MNLLSLQTMNPSFFSKHVIKIVTKNKAEVLPVSNVTLAKVKSASTHEWTSYKIIGQLTGLVAGTVSRACKELELSGLAVTKWEPKGKSRSRYVKLV